MHRYILLKHKERDTYAIKLKYGDWQESVFNSTVFIKNSSLAVDHCTDALHGFFIYGMQQRSLHNTTTSLLLSVLQNLLANALEIDKINKMMKLYPSDSLEVKFYSGLLLRKILIVPPPIDNSDLDGPMLLM
jgi:hypothetical protein